jgi:hypothetical protein
MKLGYPDFVIPWVHVILGACDPLSDVIPWVHVILSHCHTQ